MFNVRLPTDFSAFFFFFINDNVSLWGLKEMKLEIARHKIYF